MAEAGKLPASRPVPSGLAPPRRCLTGRSGARKLAALVMVAPLGLSLCLAACGGPPANSKQAMQKTLALELTNVLDGFGIPIPADQVGCAGPGKDGKMLCFGESNDSPPDSIQADYTPKRPVFEPGHCPGQLVVTGNATTLTKVDVNPCA